MSQHAFEQPELFTEISKNLEQLKNDVRIKNILDVTKIIKNKRQPKNLKHTLTSSKFEEHTTDGVSKCKHKICGVCDIIIEKNSIPSKNQKQHL